jgi:hypothetical protein
MGDVDVKLHHFGLYRYNMIFKTPGILNAAEKQ